jgi:hypothetical protein
MPVEALIALRKTLFQPSRHMPRKGRSKQGENSMVFGEKKMSPHRIRRGLILSVVIYWMYIGFLQAK